MRNVLSVIFLCASISVASAQIGPPPGGGSGTVTSASVVTANGVSAAVANPTTTPAFTFTLGAITPTTVNGNTVPTANDTVALLAATQTLSNKTLASAVLSTGATLSFLTGGGTQCIQVSNTGAVSGTGSACGGSGSTGANPTATAGPTAVNGVAPTFMRSDAAPAVQLGSASQKGIVQVDGTTITATGGIISAVGGGGGSGTVTSVSAGCGTSTGGSPITTTGSVSAAITRRVNATTTDAIVSTDCGNVVVESGASVAVQIPAAGTTGFAAGSFFDVCGTGGGVVTVTPASGTIGTLSSLTINGGTSGSPNCVPFQSDGSNYNIMDVVKGSGVQAALTNALSTAGGITSTIAHGTATIPATAIASQTCGTAITVSATAVATGDVASAGFASDPTSTTGFLPTAMLTIVPFIVPGTGVGFRPCNLTGSSITPTSLTFNWAVVR